MNPKGKTRWHSSLAFNKRFSIGRLKVSIKMRNNDGAWGRMGGGWAWKLGIDCGGWREAVIYIVWITIRITLERKAV